MTAGLIARARTIGFTRRAAAGILCFHLASTVFEGIGVGMVLPVLQYLEAGGDVARLTESSRAWAFLVQAYGALGLEVSLGALLITSFLCILVRQVFVFGRLTFVARVQLDLVARLQARLFERYLHVRLAYHEQESVGTTVSDFTEQARKAVDYFLFFLDLVGFGILFVVYGAMLTVVSPEMAAAAAAVMGATAFALRGLLREAKTVGYQLVAATRNLSSFLTERLALLRLVRLAGAEAEESDNVRRLADDQRARSYRLAILVARLSTTIDPIVAGAALLLLYFGVRVAGMSLDALGLFLVILVRLLPVVKQLIQSRESIFQSEGALNAVLDRFDQLAAAAEPRDGGRTFTGLAQAIRFDGVGFTYPGKAAPALGSIDLEIDAGRFIALVGPSGGGKSTLVDLLPRLREPTRGNILLDGVPADAFDLASLRAAIAYVPQTPLILNATAAQHIRYGQPGASDAEVRAAAARAGADGFIAALPNGYDTPLGEAGVQLSGGQRQRLDLARALVRGAAILILDEPTSHLDADSERLFRETLLNLRAAGNMTIIVIGHHLATITDADRIVVLRDGRVIEQGDHRTLLGAAGWYAQAYRKQTSDSPAPV